MKILFNWVGGKTDELKTIDKYIPEDIDTYLEPFVGGGSVFFHLNPNKAVINDVHKELINFYQHIKDGFSSEIYKFMEEHPNDEIEYYQVRESVPETKLKEAQRFFYLRKTAYCAGYRLNKNGQFTVGFGHYKLYNYERLKNPDYETLLKRTEIYNCDFEEIFEKYNDEKNFMFLDPPYDCKFTNYGFSKFGIDEHKRLAHCFKTTKIRCLMIISKTDFINELYKDYIVDEYPKKYRIQNMYKEGNKIFKNHLVIKNF
jgi:DNA adenine methylase